MRLHCFGVASRCSSAALHKNIPALRVSRVRTCKVVEHFGPLLGHADISTGCGWRRGLARSSIGLSFWLVSSIAVDHSISIGFQQPNRMRYGKRMGTQKFPMFFETRTRLSPIPVSRKNNTRRPGWLQNPSPYIPISRSPSDLNALVAHGNFWKIHPV